MEPTKEEIIRELKVAQTAAARQDFPKALLKYRWVEEHIQDDPDNLPLLRIEMGWAYYHLQEYAVAIACFEKALESPMLNEQQAFDAQRLIGFCHEAGGNLRQAKAQLEAALLRPVDDAVKRFAYFELGKIYFTQKQMHPALPMLERALPLFEDSEHEYQQTTRYYLGFIHFFQNAFSAAEHYFRDYIDHARDAAGAAPGWFGIAHILYKKETYDELERICQQIITDDPGFFDRETIAYFLCKAYAVQGKKKPLAVFLTELTQRYPRGRYATEYATLKRSLE